MIVLEPITTAQGFSATPREQSEPANKIKLTDEETGVSRVVNIAVNPFTIDYYIHSYTITINPALKEGHTYKALMYYESEQYYTWKGKIFCTAQITTALGFADVRDYSVNDGRYTENTTTNQFILND